MSTMPHRAPDPEDLVETAADSLCTGDRMWSAGVVREVSGIQPASQEGWVLVEFDDSGSPMSLAASEVVQVIESGYFFLTAEEGLAMAPHRMSEDDFFDRFQPVMVTEQNVSSVQTFETVPEGVGEEFVWTQVEGDEADGWRDFVLMPGIHRVNALNFVLCAVAWTDEDAEIEVNWN